MERVTSQPRRVYKAQALGVMILYFYGSRKGLYIMMKSDVRRMTAQEDRHFAAGRAREA